MTPLTRQLCSYRRALICGVLVLGALALRPATAVAQGQGALQVSATVRERVALDVLPGPGAGREALPPHLGMREASGLVLLQVRANSRWRVVASSYRATSAELRTRALSGAVLVSGEFRAVGEEVELARGQAGGEIALLMDFRWPDGSAVPPLSYRVEAY